MLQSMPFRNSHCWWMAACCSGVSQLRKNFVTRSQCGPFHITKTILTFAMVRIIRTHFEIVELWCWWSPYHQPKQMLRCYILSPDDLWLVISCLRKIQAAVMIFCDISAIPLRLRNRLAGSWIIYYIILVLYNHVISRQSNHSCVCRTFGYFQ